MTRKDFAKIGPAMRIPAVIGLVAAATAVGRLLDAGSTPAAVLLLLVVVLASLWGRLMGVLAAVVGFLSLNFFFTPPLRTFSVGQRDDLFDLAVFLVAALVVGSLVARSTDLRHQAEQREQERSRFEVEAREARVAAAVGRTRSGFLSAVTHNLRTPLASIKAAVSTLLDPRADLGGADRLTLLGTIHEETDRLERLVTKVLDLSRIRAGGLECSPEPTDLAELVEAAIRRLRPLVGNHRLKLEVPDGLPEIHLDVTMMEQVLLNLLENAIRFAPPGSEVKVAALLVGAEVEVRVVDRGPGIPSAERERVFEEFTRGDPPGEAAAGEMTAGVGLGLAIARALVEVHGGRIWGEETTGGGATLAFVLPVKGPR